MSTKLEFVDLPVWMSSCVKTANGEVRCWGENSTGSLGIGDTDPPTSATPVTPTPLGKIQALAAG